MVRAVAACIWREREVCDSGGMNDQHAPVPDEYDDLDEAIEWEAPPVDVYRLSTRQPSPDVSGTS